MPKLDWDVSPIWLHYPNWLSSLPGGLPGIGIRYYSLCFALVFVGGYWLFNWQLKRAGSTEHEADRFLLWAILALLAGARLGHVWLYDFQLFRGDPGSILRVWEGGLSSHGAAVALCLAVWLFTKWCGQSFLEGLDRLAFSAALGATLVRFGNFMNSELVGKVTDQTWGVRFLRYDDQYRHPAQLYEVLLGVGVFVSLWATDRAFGGEQRPRGLLSALFCTEYFVGRFLVEFWKEPQSLSPAGYFLTEGQWLSLPFAVLGFVGLFLSLTRRVPARWRVAKAA